jgi:LysM repeat protein
MNENITSLLLLLSMIISFSCKKEQENEGIVSSFFGDVTIKEGDKSRQAKVGDSIIAGMSIETGTKSVVHIHFYENVIVLTENSILSVEKFELNISANTEHSVLNLKKGDVFSKIVKRLNNDYSYQIKTPTTVVAVRGTEFGVFERNGESTVACLSGKVEAANTTLGDGYEFVEIPADKEAQITSGKPLLVKPLSAKNKMRMKDVFDKIISQTEQGFYTASYSDALWKISLKFYNDASLWPLIFMENKDLIKNPNLIYPGQQLKIPALDKDNNVNRETANKIRKENFGN